MRNLPKIWIETWFARWLDRRVLPCQKTILTRKNTYIFLTSHGLVFLLLSMGIFLGGINYQSSLMLALAFFMISFFMISMLYTYRNLVGLVIEAAHVQNCFVGQSALFSLNLTRQGSRTYESIQLIWDRNIQERVDLIEVRCFKVALLLPAHRRGIYRPGRLKIETTYPVGLLRAWTWVSLEMSCWIYPRPVNAELPAIKAAMGEGREMSQQSGLDDFSGLRRYVPGDSLKQIDWKVLARSHELYTKTFVQALDEEIWVDWQDFPCLATERRLSALCYWILYWIQANKPVGLRLPGFEQMPGCGFVHQQRCLEALARYDDARAFS